MRNEKRKRKKRRLGNKNKIKEETLHQEILIKLLGA
jgi:hypothetical protein